MKSKTYFLQKSYRHLLIFLMSCLLLQAELHAQDHVRIYTIRNGKMYIELSKRLRDSAIDSFINQYDLQALSLKNFIQKNFRDSINKAGWVVEFNTRELVAISKPLVGFEHLNEPADKILFTGKDMQISQRFPAVSKGTVYGFNRFRNRAPFMVRDSIVSFFLRGNTNAREVVLSGSFVNWSPEILKMIRTDSGWIMNVYLRPGKYWYKFIIDGNWQVDEDNLLRENDGLGNVNSVFYKTNTVLRFSSPKEFKKVFLAGSFNHWKPTELEMKRTPTAWEIPIYLADGTHTYRFIADGQWYTDPANNDKLPNEFDDYNSVIRIGKPYKFWLPGYTDANDVTLSGSFNGWRKDELYMQKTYNGWELSYTPGPGNYDYMFIVDGKELPNMKGPLVIEPNYTFRLKGFENARQVFLAGDFNDWEPGNLLMKRVGDEWIFTVHLSIGKHLYKFIVDGKWIKDPANTLWEENEFGTGDSVIWFEN